MATTITCPIPENITPLSPNGFMFNITRLPDLAFFCQSVNIPGINLGAPEFGNPFNVQPIPANKPTNIRIWVFFKSINLDCPSF